MEQSINFTSTDSTPFHSARVTDADSTQNWIHVEILAVLSRQCFLSFPIYNIARHSCQRPGIKQLKLMLLFIVPYIFAFVAADLGAFFFHTQLTRSKTNLAKL